MALHDVERFLHSLNRDGEQAAAFQRDRHPIIESVPELTVDERRMLAEADVLALYRHGLHPLLLAQASRFFGMTMPEFLTALAPATGERTS